MSATPVWIDAQANYFFYDESLAMFGGGRGLRDAALLQSALARTVNQHLNKADGDAAILAVAYAFGLAKTPPRLWRACLKNDPATS